MAITFHAGPHTLVKHDLTAKDQQTKFFAERDIHTEMPTDGDSIDTNGNNGALQIKNFNEPEVESIKELNKEKKTVLVPVRVSQGNGKGSLTYVKASDFEGGGGKGRDPDEKSINVTNSDTLQLYDWATANTSDYWLAPNLTSSISNPLFIRKGADNKLGYLGRARTDFADSVSLDYRGKQGNDKTDKMQLFHFASPQNGDREDFVETVNSEIVNPKQSGASGTNLLFLARKVLNGQATLKYVNLGLDLPDGISIDRSSADGASKKNRLQLFHFNQPTTTDQADFQPKEDSTDQHFRLIVRDETNSSSPTLKYINLQPDPTDDQSITRISASSTSPKKKYLQLNGFDTVNPSEGTAKVIPGNVSSVSPTYSTLTQNPSFKVLVVHGDNSKTLDYYALQSPAIIGGDGANVIPQTTDGTSISISVYYA